MKVWMNTSGLLYYAAEAAGKSDAEKPFFDPSLAAVLALIPEPISEVNLKEVARLNSINGPDDTVVSTAEASPASQLPPTGA